MKYQPDHLPLQHSPTGLHMLDTVWGWGSSEAAASGREDSSFTHSRFVWLTELFYFRVRHSLWENFLIRFYSLEETEHIGLQDCWEVKFETALLIGIFAYNFVFWNEDLFFIHPGSWMCRFLLEVQRRKGKCVRTTHQDSKKHLDISKKKTIGYVPGTYSITLIVLCWHSVIFHPSLHFWSRTTTLGEYISLSWGFFPFF